MRRRTIVLAVILGAVLVTAGGIFFATSVLAVPAVVGQVNNVTMPRALNNSAWTLTHLTVDGQDQSIATTAPATLRFGPEAEKVSGNSGCNWYGGDVLVVGSHLSFSNLAMTLMACADQSRMTQESVYTQALARVDSYSIDGDTLTLTGDNGGVVIVFGAGATEITK